MNLACDVIKVACLEEIILSSRPARTELAEILVDHGVSVPMTFPRRAHLSAKGRLFEIHCAGNKDSGRQWHHRCVLRHSPVLMSNYANAATWVKVCGDLAPVLSILVCLSPVPTIQRIVNREDVGNLPLLPYSAMVVNGTLWLAYGVLTENPTIWSCRGFCLCVGLYYMTRFIQFSPKSAPTLPGTVNQHIAGVLLGFAGVSALIFSHVMNNPAWLLGKLGILTVVAMFASPLTVLGIVIKSKSAEDIPLPFTSAIAVSCFLWSVYGIGELHDLHIIIPNVLGLVLALLQLTLKAIYNETTQKFLNRNSIDKEDDKSIPLGKMEAVSGSVFA